MKTIKERTNAFYFYLLFLAYLLKYIMVYSDWKEKK
jgi:hypothetical protein